MTKRNNSENLHPLHNRFDLDMLANLLEPEDSSYPWNPADEKSEEYFHELEQHFAITDVLDDEELTQCSHNFYQQLDLEWSKNLNNSYYKHTTKESVKVNSFVNLPSDLKEKIPQEWLAKITNRAGEIFKSGQSMGEQLIECVQSVLPKWDSEDLNVLARPYAFAMRSEETNSDRATSVLKSLGDREWGSLTELEQARVSLAVAYHAIQELSSTKNS
ncbi:MAG: hypothetical protein AAF378_10320 [Cyanobacteria bacterium P01_A01_bin.84]